MQIDIKCYFVEAVNIIREDVGGLNADATSLWYMSASSLNLISLIRVFLILMVMTLVRAYLVLVSSLVRYD